jgi:lipopolysaccharide export system permease protein
VITILHRMIFIELFRVFFLSWVGLTGMILLGGVIAEATQQGLGPTQILEIIPFLLPSMMPYTLPTTTLFATCVVYGRLAHDNEILAVKAAGINLIQVALPGIVLGAAASIGTMALYWDTIPRTHWGLRTHFISNLEEFLYNVLRKDGCIRYPQIEYTIYVKRVEDRDLIDALFLHRDNKNGNYDIIARGKKADITVDMDSKTIIVRMWNASVSKGNDNGFYEEAPPLPVEIAGILPEKSRPTDMSWLEMVEFRDKFQTEIAEFNDQIAKHQAAIMIQGNNPQEFGEFIRNRTLQVNMLQSQITNIDAEYQMRPALSLGCFCFVLVGCPIGIWFSRSDYLSSFITCFLPIIVVYYPLMLCGINLAKSGRLHPAAAIWPANVVIAIIAAYLMRRLMRN